MKSRSDLVFRLAVALLCAAALAGMPASAKSPKIWDYEIVAEHPHDPGAFTQGLFYSDGHLFEGTGLNGASSIRKVDVKTGAVVQQRDLAAEYFGEGIAPWGDDIVALTWKNGKGFVLNGENFETEREFAYDGEGWGITSDGKELIMSDGTAALRFLDPKSFTETRRVTVTYGAKTLPELNELEWIDGEVFANIWRTEIIARIDPATGVVVGLIDMRGLRARLGPEGATADVLNGIAYDPQTKRLFVTGKRWPKLYEIRLVERPGSGGE